MATKKTEAVKKTSTISPTGIAKQQQQIAKNEIEEIDSQISLLQARKKAIQDRIK